MRKIFKEPQCITSGDITSPLVNLDLPFLFFFKYHARVALFNWKILATVQLYYIKPSRDSVASKRLELRLEILKAVRDR